MEHHLAQRGQIEPLCALGDRELIAAHERRPLERLEVRRRPGGRAERRADRAEVPAQRASGRPFAPEQEAGRLDVRLPHHAPRELGELAVDGLALPAAELQLDLTDPAQVTPGAQAGEGLLAEVEHARSRGL